MHFHTVLLMMTIPLLSGASPIFIYKRQQYGYYGGGGGSDEEMRKYDQMGLSWMIKPRYHKTAQDGAGGNWKTNPVNPYEEALQGKWVQNPFQRIFLYRMKMQEMFKTDPLSGAMSEYGPNWGPWRDMGPLIGPLVWDGTLG